MRNRTTPHGRWQAPKWRSGAPAWKLNADNPCLVSLVDQLRRAELAENIGTFGIVIALLGLLWMFGKCGLTLFPGLFQ